MSSLIKRVLWANKNDRMLERVQHKIVKKNQNRAKKAGSTTQSRRCHNQRVDKDQVVEKKIRTNWIVYCGQWKWTSIMPNSGQRKSKFAMILPMLPFHSPDFRIIQISKFRSYFFVAASLLSLYWFFHRLNFRSICIFPTWFCPSW